MSKRPEEIVVDALNDVKDIFANIWGHGYEAGIKAAEKATEKRLVREVIETIENRADVFDNDHMYEHGETVKDVAKELRKKYGVK